MTNTTITFANILSIGFVIFSLAAGLISFAAGLPGIVSWAIGVVGGLYFTTFLASTKVNRFSAIMDCEN